MTYTLHIIPNDEPHFEVTGLSLDTVFALIRGNVESNISVFSYTIYPDDETN